ncbi:MAG: hypothetical protein LQ341_007804, partial [Variospora aurantia]
NPITITTIIKAPSSPPTRKMSSTNAANAAANTAASASFALCLASRKTPGPTASGITILHLAALKRKAPKAAAAPPEHDPTHSGVTYYDLARFDVIGVLKAGGRAGQ